VICETLGLAWAVVVHGTNLADAAYERAFLGWVRDNLLGVELEINSKPPGSEGFVPVKWRWVSERTFGVFNLFRWLDKDHEKTTQSAEAWVLWQNCQLILNRMH
jgi:putative transposase